MSASRSLKQALASGETLVFGHRGAMARAPMNTLAAFERARADGAQGVELDLQLSRDGALVVIHDSTVDATTDGAGQVGGMTLAELKRLDAGSWFAPDYASERIPTLNEVFDAVGDDLFINIEIKTPPHRARQLEKALADCVRRRGNRDRIIVSCFHPKILASAKGMMPMVLAGFLYQPDMLAEYNLPSKNLWHEALHPRQDMVDRYFMSWAKAQSYFVNVWTVNEPERARELAGLGVNIIITDDPASIIGALA